MGTPKDVADAVVDAFVAAVNSSRREPKSRESIPEGCLGPAARNHGYFDWHIALTGAGSWLKELTTRMPFGWPDSFYSLISRYQFPSFGCGPLQFYPVGLATDQSELRNAVFRDEAMVAVLWEHGYLPFARPEDWSYDPVCFDCDKGGGGNEPAVVRIDHEEILCRDVIRVVQVLSPGFPLLLKSLAAGLRAGSLGAT
jgi:hypothetical protein